MRYPKPTFKLPGDHLDLPAHGQIAAYAWVEDYHQFLPGRLKDLVAFIESQVGHTIENRWYTDTGPLLERELAQRAGLGWIGKNTCLIHPRQGSYFLLAEILLGIELDPDPPFLDDRCGTCTRCMVACPTGCILPDRTIDARRCISYLTIELKGRIPPELRKDMDSWVFGCDVCQQVCPWNHFAASGGEVSFRHRLACPEPDLHGEISLDTNSFNLKYRYSPIRRAKRRGYLRNVAVALGNARHPGMVPALGKVLMAEPEPLVRAHAAWALGQVGDAPAIDALRGAMYSETHPDVKQEIQAALDSMRSD
jgi:epoxyqueuosine reductase